MKPRRPLQFSLATLMAAVTGYALLFGILSSLGLTIPAFLIVTLYFTTIVYSQWAVFGGWNPFAASFLTGSILFALAFLADPVRTQAWPLALAFTAATGGVVGIGIAGYTDVWLLLSQIMRRAVPKPWAPERPPHDVPGSGEATGRLRLALLVVLAGAFYLGMLWGRATGQRWIPAVLWEPVF